MTDAAIFAGSYCDLKFVKSRSVAQVIVELPIERAAEFVAAFGAPVPGAEIPVALARINPKKAAGEPRSQPDEAAAPKERKPFKSLPLPQQAAMRCQEPEFLRFLADRLYGPGNDVPLDANWAANEVRHYCGVTSRSKIADVDESGEKWRALDKEYLDWKHSVSYEGVAQR